jgi:hypothetical protein
MFSKVCCAKFATAVTVSDNVLRFYDSPDGPICGSPGRSEQTLTEVDTARRVALVRAGETVLNSHCIATSGQTLAPVSGNHMLSVSW